MLLLTKYCPKCKTTKSTIDFYVAKERSDGLRGTCKKCCTISHRESYHKNRNGWKKASLAQIRIKNIKKRYGLTITEYEAILAKGCQVCSRQTKRLALDHDHRTGKVRGCLCTKCNTALGLLGDSVSILKNMVAYLEGTSS